MGTQLMPPGAWECHFHVMDPSTFPFKSDRTYTPAPALLETFMSQNPATNFLLVQCSVESGVSGILHHLKRVKHEYPANTFRAEINVESGKELSDAEMDEYHDLGVRAIRVHGIIGVGGGVDVVGYVKGEFRRLCAIAARKGWYIAAMCSLDTWLAVLPWLINNEDEMVRKTKVIVEHNGRADPTRPIDQYTELQKFLDLLDANKDRLYVKLCGINRLEVASDPPGRMTAIPAAVLAIAERVPDNIVWGSDWPHVVLGGENRLKIREGKKVDLENELTLLRKALPGSTWQKLMVSNPGRLFMQ